MTALETAAISLSPAQALPRKQLRVPFHCPCLEMKVSSNFCSLAVMSDDTPDDHPCPILRYAKITGTCMVIGGWL